MITLDQVQQLEKKVNDAVDLINRLKSEKIVLEEKIETFEFQILELEEQTEKFNKDQNEIEDKIIGALNQLEEIEAEDSKTPEIVEDSAEFSVSDEPVIVETEEKSDISVDYKKTEKIDGDIESDESDSDETILPDTDSEVTLNVNEEDNQSELQEAITENPQVGLPMDENSTEEIQEELDNPADNKAERETVEDEPSKENKPEQGLFEQSLDIF